MPLWELALLIVGGLLAYELARGFVLRKVQASLHRRAKSFAEQHGVRVDLFKFGGRLLVKEELLNDLVIQRAMLGAAQGTLPSTLKGGPPAAPCRPEEIRRAVESYIDEIVPAFSLAAYYQFGMTLAAAAIRAVYRPVIDAASRERVRKELPADATAVFVINHRSNFDYVVVGWALARQVAVSYAVGEWARVWPLDSLFKAFGGFFVRRGFPDPLYHTVLRRYLQLITRRGVTQGIFPEGGLTRDGALRSPKAGLLDAILQLTTEPDFGRELYFVPVGINYDRVLEDGSLLAEKRGKEHPPTPAEKLLNGAKLLYRIPWGALVNVARAATGRLQRHGYVAVAFGRPVHWKELAQQRNVDLAKLDDEARRNAAKDLAGELMKHIAQCIPATPVAMVARCMLELSDCTRSDLTSKVLALRNELLAKGIPLAMGGEFEEHKRVRAQLEEDAERNRDLSRMEGDMLAQDEAEAIARLGVEHLARRRILQRTEDRVRVLPGEELKDLLVYYARSLAALERSP
ncbi:MAG: 1-acyl-sn-glycerol-3-phosphate acyltransferase [Deltaproteobacteria bacterium]|nr:1-acyl-sn-glycerol-3-phosphate acyltransferase [Deltaproteobacteria bacterium]